VVLTTLLTRANGGSSTALDIAEGLHSLGFEVRLMLTADSPWLYRLSRHRKGITALAHRQLECIDLGAEFGPRTSAGGLRASSRQALRTRLTRHLKSLVKSANRRLTARRARRVAANATIVIDAGVGLGRDIGRARSLFPSACLVMNHNGSVEAFERHFLSPSSLTPSDSRDRYLRLVSNYDLLLFQSADVAEEVREIAANLSDRRVVVSPSCQEADVSAARGQESPFSESPFPIVVVASVQRRKGQGDAVEALAMLDAGIDATLHFVGPVVDAAYADDVRMSAQSLGVAERVSFHGLRSDYLRFLAHASVVLQPSSAEGVSRVLRESMLLERPIVAYAIPGTTSVLTDGVDALLVARGEVGALADAVRSLAHDPERAASLSAAAREAYERNHSWEGFKRGLEALVAEAGAVGPGAGR